MKKILCSLLLLNSFLFSSGDPVKTDVTHNKMSLSEAAPFFDSIKDLEIIIGTGPDHIYVFVDPVCPHSRAFISLIHDTEHMRDKYTYHIWLYRLPKFNSIPYIYTIYSQKKSEQLNALYGIMVLGDKTPLLPIKKITSNVIDNYKKIADVGVKMDIYKRPYLFVSKKGN